MPARRRRRAKLPKQAFSIQDGRKLRTNPLESKKRSHRRCLVGLLIGDQRIPFGLDRLDLAEQ